MRNSRGAWENFELMVRSGVPHAMEIASELVRHDLCSPLYLTDKSQQVDLQFYCVVHRAYRLGVLPKLMERLKSLRQFSSWTIVRDRQDIQLWIVGLCSKCVDIPPMEINDQIMDFLTSQEHSNSAA